MMSAAHEFLGYYLDEFDKKFKDAWQETVVALNKETKLTCDKDDSSPECKGAWSSFWESEEVKDDCMPPWGHSDMEYLSKNNNKNEIWEPGQITEELMETIKREGYDYTPIPSKKRWILPVEETKIQETDETEYFITFPDDLLEAANLKEGDQIEWVDNKDGSHIMKKVPQTYDEMIAAGYTMTADGFWIKEN